MKTRTIILLGVALLVAVVAAVPLFVHSSVQSRIGSEHVFTLSEQPESLTEEFAVAKARETLSRDGLDIVAWQPMSDGGTVTSNRAVIMFTNGSATRFVHVELDGRRVVCQTSIGK